MPERRLRFRNAGAVRVAVSDVSRRRQVYPRRLELCNVETTGSVQVDVGRALRDSSLARVGGRAPSCHASKNTPCRVARGDDAGVPVEAIRRPRARARRGGIDTRARQARQAIIEHGTPFRKFHARTARVKLAEASENRRRGTCARDARAADLPPDDAAVQLKASGLYPGGPVRRCCGLKSPGQRRRQPAGADSLANALAGLKDFDAAVSELEERSGSSHRGETLQQPGAISLAAVRRPPPSGRSAVELDGGRLIPGWRWRISIGRMLAGATRKGAESGRRDRSEQCAGASEGELLCRHEPRRRSGAAPEKGERAHENAGRGIRAGGLLRRQNNETSAQSSSLADRPRPPLLPRCGWRHRTGTRRRAPTRLARVPEIRPISKLLM